MQRASAGVSVGNQQSRYASSQQQRRPFQPNSLVQNQSNQQLGRTVNVNRRKRRFADKVIPPEVISFYYLLMFFKFVC